MALTIKNNIKKGTDLAVSGEFIVELEKKVKEMLEKSVERAKANSRRTLFKRDLWFKWVK